MSLFSMFQYVNNSAAPQPALEIQNAEDVQNVSPETFTAPDGEAQAVISQESFGDAARLTETVNTEGETCLHAELMISSTAMPITLEEVTAQTKETKASPTIKGEANKPLVTSKTIMSEALERANERNKRNKPRSR